MLLKRYILYLARWQLSTPILAFCVAYFVMFGDFWATVIANFIGGLIFFWVDRFIFTKDFNEPLWGVKENVVCVDCGKDVSRGYRVLMAQNYDKRNDPKPEYRCETCSNLKLNELRQRGIKL